MINTEPSGLFDKTAYYADHPPSIVLLEIEQHFNALDDKQKQYAHHLSKAAWAGQRALLRQVSSESEDIYDLILNVHKACGGDYDRLAKETSVSSPEIGLWLDYAAQFLGNSGNYKAFGDAKFIPRLSKDTLKQIANVSDSAKAAFDRAMSTGGGIFESKDSALMHMGYPADGHMSTYYPASPTITRDEIKAVGDAMETAGLMPENTRLQKRADGDFTLLIASGVRNPPGDDRDLGKKEYLELKGGSEGKKCYLQYGDYLNEMARAALELKKAEKVAANETEVKMLEEYAKSFGTGSMKAHYDSQRYWIRDKKPVVETNIGFIETLRDPHGVRAEWEGLVATVNLERTKAFDKLVSVAPEMLAKLPWSKAFEKDKFLTPDFTSLEVLSFTGSSIPNGINIPNYDLIRQSEGFKNVSLGNVMSAKVPNEKIPFVRHEDQEVYRAKRDPAFEVQVGIHELLGHGCGKLLQETSPGRYNFDIQNPPISPLTGEPIKSWYKPGQTWGSVFGSIASPYEECRAECVAMVLACDFEILKIFGFGDGSVDMDGEAGDVLYSVYLTMARAGIAALEFWDPASRKWGQVHMRARFSILQTFINAGKDFVKLHYTQDDLSDLEVHVNRDKILSTGRKCVEVYLQKLHIYKVTADLEQGTKLFDEMCAVDEWWEKKVRPAVLSQKQPRKVFVQVNTVLDEATGQVKLTEYDPTPQGMIQSFYDREKS